MIIEQNFKFEIAPEDEPGIYTWNEAIEHLQNKGDGWRLPTREELFLMHRNRETTVGLSNVICWSSSVYNSKYAWVHFFYTGYQGYYNKTFYYHVRAVRDIPKSKSKQMSETIKVKIRIIINNETTN